MPRFTPSRVPLLDQRWTVVPAGAAATAARRRWRAASRRIAGGRALGARRRRLRVLAVVLRRLQPPAEHRGGACAAGVPLRVERDRRRVSVDSHLRRATRRCRRAGSRSRARPRTSPPSSPATDEYVLYVVQLERQTGEWVFVGGYAGEVVTDASGAADVRARSRADASRSSRARRTPSTRTAASAFETAVRQNGDGVYVKAEYSQAAASTGARRSLPSRSPATPTISRPIPPQLSRRAALRYSF